MPRSSLAMALILLGAVIIVVGLLTWAGALSWFGRLPGDIRVERGGTRLYVPLVSMLLVSGVVSIVANIARRFWN
jgi:uncharacterized membrane protein YidH (DUF202 family)